MFGEGASASEVAGALPQGTHSACGSNTPKNRSTLKRGVLTARTSAEKLWLVVTAAREGMPDDCAGNSTKTPFGREMVLPSASTCLLSSSPLTLAVNVGMPDHAQHGQELLEATGIIDAHAATRVAHALYLQSRARCGQWRE